MITGENNNQFEPDQEIMNDNSCKKGPKLSRIWRNK